MKTLLCGLGLLALGGAAAAEWTRIGGNEQISFYADLATRKAGEGGVQMDSLVGSKAPRQVGEASFSSIRTRFEFDCAGRRIRELETSFHAGPMGDGAAVGKQADAGAWEPIAEGTAKDALAAVACEKK